MCFCQQQKYLKEIELCSKLKIQSIGRRNQQPEFLIHYRQYFVPLPYRSIRVLSPEGGCGVDCCHQCQFQL
jgi:hypothetical protein